MATACQMLVAPPSKKNETTKGPTPGVAVLQEPPDFTLEGSKFNTVKGHTQTRHSSSSDVYVVYENGRAYPHYLLRYYFGERDPKRTPYAEKSEVPASSLVLSMTGANQDAQNPLQEQRAFDAS
eukprot:SAG31_NODE_16763_length_697_cov_0.989967_1_plen_124_part_00